jgi:hypothetical protein
MRKFISERKLFLWKFAVIAGLIAAQVPLWYGVAGFAEKLHQNQVTGQQLWIVQHRNDLALNQIRKQQSYLSQLDTVTPPSSSLAKIIEKVELLADDSDVVLKVHNIVKEANKNARTGDLLKVANISLEVTGLPDKLMGYLARLEHMQELTTVTAISLREVPKTEKMTEGLKPYVMTIQIMFYLKNDE